MHPATHTGQCLCRAITLHATLDGEVAVCHCTMCRNWTGGPFFTLECDSDVRIDGEAYLGVYDSSEWAQRGFCRQCGSHLFYRLKQGGLMALSAGIFPQDSLHLAKQIFIEEKPAHYRFANPTLELTGAQVFAAFEPE